MKGLMKVRKSLLISLILVVLLSQCFTAFAATAPIYEVEYLSNVYQIEISEDITKGEFEQHLSMALNDDQF